MSEGRPLADGKPLIVASGLSGASWGLAWAVLAPYLRSLGYTGTEYGLMGAAAVLTGALASLAGGLLSDTWGARRTASLGLALSGLAYVLVAGGSKPLVAAGFALNGLAGGLGMTAMQALAARLGPESMMHYTLSYYAAASTLGGALGSFAGWIPVWASRLSGLGLVDAYRYSLVAGGLLSLAAGVWVLRAPEALRGRGGVSAFSLGALRSALRGLSPRFYRIALIEAVIGFGAAMSIHNIDYYFAAKYHVSSAGLGTVLGAQQLVMAALMVYLPRLSDRAGGVVRLYLALTLSSVPLLVAMTLTGNYLVAATLYLVRSVLMNAANPLLSAYTFRLVPAERRGLASAFLNLAWTIPAGAGRAVGGALLDVNLELPLRLTAAIYTAALAALARVARGDAAAEAKPRARAGAAARAAVAAGAVPR